MSTPLPEFYKTQTSRKSVFQASLKFVLFIFFLILIGWGLSYLFGYLANEKASVGELASEIAHGKAEFKNIAAAEWTRQLRQGDPTKKRPTLAQSQDLVKELEKAEGPTSYRASLAFILGFSEAGSTAKQDLQKFLNTPQLPAEIEIQSLLSLIRLGFENPEDLKPFLIRAQNEDPSLRKVAAYALGQKVLNQENLLLTQQGALEDLLNDPVKDVRWNAAFSLVKNKRNTANAALFELLGELATEQTAELSPEKFELYQNLISALSYSQSPELRQKLREVAENLKNFKLKQLANEVLNASH